MSESAFATLRGFVRRPAPIERCELCNAALPPEHQHLIEPANRKLSCACEACAILFPTQGDKKYKRVPRHIRYLADFQLTDSQWDGLMMPINMAFFFANAAGRVTAVYPSPAGATESLLPLETWAEIAAENPELPSMEPDVEALLVNRLGAHRGFPVNQYYLLPIDQCFKLVGLVRTNWRGFSGGEELWQELGRYFAALAERAVLVEERQNA